MFPSLCDFRVELAVERGRLGVLFFDDGFKVLHPGRFAQVTNLDSGESVVLHTTGTIHERIEPTDGAGSLTTVHIIGHGLLLFSPRSRTGSPPTSPSDGTGRSQRSWRR